MQLLKQRLRNFKLSGIYHNLEERVSYAKEKSLSYPEFLGLLLEDEENNRRANSYKKRYSRAKLPAHKNIEDFDFSFEPSIDKRTIKADNTYYQKVDYYLKPDLLIMDELGFKKLPGYSADDFFEIISKRYEKGSVIITTNKTFEQWGDIFTDNVLASAILDRVVHYSAIIKINGPSFRAKALRKGGDKF